MKTLSLMTVPFLAVGLAVTGRAQEIVEGFPSGPPEARQFDFWLGEWDVQVRYPDGKGGWVDGVTAVAKIYSILGGKAILELWNGDAPNPRGFITRGFSLRHYDARREEWMLALNWPGPDSPQFSTLSGAFHHGRGEFFRTRTDSEGSETLVRYTFADITPSSLRWDGASSQDGGQSWSTGLIFQFTRRGNHAEWPRSGEAAHTFEDGSLCGSTQFRGFDAIEGRWMGTYSTADGDHDTAHRASMVAYRALDGCAVFDIVRYEGELGSREVFRIRSYVPRRDAWVQLALDDAQGTGFRFSEGRWDEDGITFDEQASAAGGARRRVRWLSLTADSISYEILRSDDDGASWQVTGRVELQRE